MSSFVRASHTILKLRCIKMRRMGSFLCLLYTAQERIWLDMEYKHLGHVLNPSDLFSTHLHLFDSMFVTCIILNSLLFLKYFSLILFFLSFFLAYFRLFPFSLYLLLRVIHSSSWALFGKTKNKYRKFSKNFLSRNLYEIFPKINGS